VDVRWRGAVDESSGDRGPTTVRSVKSSRH
jgi:hypothetical protein